jgi:hypothetical protein
MSKIQLRIYYDAAYHVLDEAVSYVNDFQPSALPLRSQAIDVLELAVLRATGLRSTKRPRGTADGYCIALGSGWAWVVGHRKGQVQSISKTKLILINYLGALRSV